MFGLAKVFGGQNVEAGNYWNLTTGERLQLAGASVLPGDAEDIYYRVPAAGMLAVAPILGLAYAMFLPFIGIAMVATAAGRKLFGGMSEGLWKAASFGWQPSEAYLLGKKGKKGKKGKSEEEVEKTDKTH